MNLPSCTTRSEALGPFLAAAVLCLGGCATKRSLPAAPPKASQPTASQASSQPTLLNLSYGNSASHATLQVDLQANDVYVDMSGAAPRRDTARPAPAAVAPAAPAPQQPIYVPVPQMVPNVTGAGGGSVRTDSVIRREETRTIVEASARERADRPARDTVTRRVVASIRKAQDAFYKGRYGEAQLLAQKAIDDHPTAEAYALAGSVAWVQKDWALARKHWNAALELDPEFPGIAGMLSKLPAEGTP